MDTPRHRTSLQGSIVDQAIGAANPIDTRESRRRTRPDDLQTNDSDGPLRCDEVDREDVGADRDRDGRDISLGHPVGSKRAHSHLGNEYNGPSSSPSHGRGLKRVKRDGSPSDTDSIFSGVENAVNSVSDQHANAAAIDETSGGDQADTGSSTSDLNSNRGRSASIFPSTPRIPHVDLSAPQYSPRRSRSRSPAKHSQFRIFSQPVARMEPIADVLWSSSPALDVISTSKAPQPASSHSHAATDAPTQVSQPDATPIASRAQLLGFSSPLTPLPPTPTPMVPLVYHVADVDVLDHGCAAPVDRKDTKISTKESTVGDHGKHSGADIQQHKSLHRLVPAASNTKRPDHDKLDAFKIMMSKRMEGPSKRDRRSDINNTGDQSDKAAAKLLPKVIAASVNRTLPVARNKEPVRTTNEVSSRTANGVPTLAPSVAQPANKGKGKEIDHGRVTGTLDGGKQRAQSVASEARKGRAATAASSNQPRPSGSLKSHTGTFKPVLPSEPLARVKGQMKGRQKPKAGFKVLARSAVEERGDTPVAGPSGVHQSRGAKRDDPSRIPNSRPTKRIRLSQELGSSSVPSSISPVLVDLNPESSSAPVRDRSPAKIVEQTTRSGPSTEPIIDPGPTKLLVSPLLDCPPDDKDITTIPTESQGDDEGTGSSQPEAVEPLAMIPTPFHDLNNNKDTAEPVRHGDTLEPSATEHPVPVGLAQVDSPSDPSSYAPKMLVAASRGRGRPRGRSRAAAIPPTRHSTRHLTRARAGNHVGTPSSSIPAVETEDATPNTNTSAVGSVEHSEDVAVPSTPHKVPDNAPTTSACTPHEPRTPQTTASLPGPKSHTHSAPRSVADVKLADGVDTLHVAYVDIVSGDTDVRSYDKDSVDRVTDATDCNGALTPNNLIIPSSNDGATNSEDAFIPLKAFRKSFAQPTASSAAKTVPKSPQSTSRPGRSPTRIPRPSSVAVLSNRPSTSTGHHARHLSFTSGSSSLSNLENALAKFNTSASRSSTSLGFNASKPSGDSSGSTRVHIWRGGKRSVSTEPEGSNAGHIMPTSTLSAASDGGVSASKRLIQHPITSFMTRGNSQPFSGKDATGKTFPSGRGFPKGPLGRAPKASRPPGLPSVLGSPVKGGAGVANGTEEPTIEADGQLSAEMVKAHEEETSTAAVFTDEPHSSGTALTDMLERGEITTAELAVLLAKSTPKTKSNLGPEWKNASRRVSMASEMLTKSLDVLSQPKKRLTTMGPPHTPVQGTRTGLRSSDRRQSSEDDASLPDDNTSSTVQASSAPASDTPSSIAKKKKEPRHSILKGCIIFADVRNDEGEDSGELFVTMLKSLGARVLNSVTQSVTHIVYKNGQLSTLKRYRALSPKPLVVGISWVVECAEKLEHLDETKYLINLDNVNIAGVRQPRRRSMIPKMLALDCDDSDNFADTSANSSTTGADSSMDMSTH